MKKGFTLIELLAVIIILAVIALITIPLIMDTIEEARNGSFKDSAYGIITAAEQKQAKESLNNGGILTVQSFDLTGNSLTFKGSKPKKGAVIINKNGEVALEMNNGSICITKGYTDKDVIMSDITEDNPCDGSGMPKVLYEVIKADAQTGTPYFGQISPFTGTNSNVTLDKNGVGIFEYTENEIPVYYYRGNVSNNNVYFEGFCWKIIRTTQTGGVKLIYNGTATLNEEKIECNSTNPELSGVLFNGTSASIDKLKYWDADSSSNEDLGFSNVAKSVNSWVQSNLSQNEEQLEKINWCMGLDDFTESSGTTTYAVTTRLAKEPYTPSLDCGQELENIAGLISADEVTLAGGHYGIANSNFYLNTGSTFWTLSPQSYKSSAASVFVLKNGNLAASKVNSNYGYRPVVSLKSGINVIGRGTATNPYIVQ